MPNLYETLLIVTPEADDERLNAVIGDLRTVVENDGGTVLQAGVWERRKLAYQVKGKSEGVYVLMYADGSNTLPAALKYRMRLDESILRSMVLRIEDQQETDLREEIAKADHSQDAKAVEAQRAAAERRHEAEAAAAAMSLEEMVAAEEAEAAEQPAVTGEAPVDEVPAAEAAGAGESQEIEEAAAGALPADEAAAPEPAAETAAEPFAPEPPAEPATDETAEQQAPGDDEEKEN
jgi:small subunit ribosomal protein S6